MSDPTSYKIHCTECLKPLPDEAEFCPYCGDAVLASTRADRAREQFGTEISEVEIDSGEARGWGMPRLSRRAVAGAVVFGVSLLVGIVGSIALFGSWAPSTSGWSMSGGPGSEKAPAEGRRTEEVSLEKAETSTIGTVDVGRFSSEFGVDSQTDHQSAIVSHDGSEILRLYTANLSGFESLEHRTGALRRRIEWAARRHAVRTSRGLPSEISVRTKGPASEVVWSDGAVEYRLLRVTREDVRHWNQRPGEELSRQNLVESYARRVQSLFSKLGSEHGV